MTNKDVKKENRQIRNIFLIASVVYWLGYFLVSIDDPIKIGDAYALYVFLVGMITGSSAMVIKIP